LIGYCLRSGNWAVFRCTGETPYDDAMWPVFEVLDWTGKVIPADELLAMLPVRKGVPRRNPFGAEHAMIFAAPSDRFAIVDREAMPAGRIRRLGCKTAVQCSEYGPALALWSSLDDLLAQEWKLE
jgi:hypothetical protein